MLSFDPAAAMDNSAAMDQNGHPNTFKPGHSCLQYVNPPTAQGYPHRGPSYPPERSAQPHFSPANGLITTLQRQGGSLMDPRYAYQTWETAGNAGAAGTNTGLTPASDPFGIMYPLEHIEARVKASIKSPEVIHDPFTSTGSCAWLCHGHSLLVVAVTHPYVLLAIARKMVAPP